jgi:hypothetical protein
MADVYISLAWILESPLERSRKFILYGLGQAKLQLEHAKSQIADREPSPAEGELIRASESWIDSQRFTFLTEVNVGSWSGISTREMAEQANCIDFYNYVYSPFSACAHSTWHHVARFNLKHCANPLHRYHRVPYDPELRLDTHYVYLAAKYLQKTLCVFDEEMGVSVGVPSAFDTLCDGLDEIDASWDESESRADEDSDATGDADNMTQIDP